MPRRIQDQRIVIVEDDPHISQSLKDFFGDRNVVDTYGSAEEAIAAEGTFEGVRVFILDYKLPGMNGIDLFKRLQARFPAAKYILITGEMSYDMAENSRGIGLDALILKPFDFVILEDNISGLIAA
jgi:two-component system response regulator GlrR